MKKFKVFFKMDGCVEIEAPTEEDAEVRFEEMIEEDESWLYEKCTSAAEITYITDEGDVEETVKPYIVRSVSYSGDDFAEQFDTYEEAKKCVLDDLETVKRNMVDEGYQYAIVNDDDGLTEIYAKNQDSIYYEYRILSYGGNGIKYYINHLDEEHMKVQQELLDVLNGEMDVSKLSSDVRQEYKDWLLLEEQSS